MLHLYDKGEATLEDTLGAVLLLGDTKKNEPLYRRVLKEKPWKQCPCNICKECGIDVVIFRIIETLIAFVIVMVGFFIGRWSKNR